MRITNSGIDVESNLHDTHDQLSVGDKSLKELGSISGQLPVNELDSVSDPSPTDRTFMPEPSTDCSFTSNTSKQRQLRISTNAIEEVDLEGTSVFHRISFSDLIRIIADITNPHRLSFQYRRETFLHTLSYRVEQVGLAELLTA